MENKKRYLHNAEVAFSNKQYSEALVWYQKVLELTPNDIQVLSKAGAICVPLGRFDDALRFFGHAKELDPNNGDNLFNYANACFFHKNYVGAFNGYVEAEKMGCSEDVTPRLYYQLAMICSMRQDIKSALVYFDKCEKIDTLGVISLSSDFISEKLKLYMVLQDFSNAAKCAAQLVAIQPTQFRSYMVYFSILMARKDFEIAEKILKEAQLYAEITKEDEVTLVLQFAALYMAKGENAQAIDLLEKQWKLLSLQASQKVSILITLSEAYMKAEQYEKAISCLQFILNGNVISKISEMANVERKEREVELTPEEIEAMMQTDMEIIQEKIDMGELSADLGLYAEMEYDEDGIWVPYYEEGMFTSLDNIATEGQKDSNINIEEKTSFEISADMKEKIYFTLLSCYLAMDDFVSAEYFAKILKQSENKYYCYYGVYTCALVTRKLKKDSALIDKLYAEAIAFFRNKSFADASDTMAIIFRARLYAEQGKYEKAKELAMLMAESDRNSVLRYMEECKA